MRPYPNFRDLERIHGVSWHDLVNLEPRLAKLLWEAHGAGATCRYWGDVERAFAPLRNTLTMLVGFSCKRRWHFVLGGSAAYDVAYWKLYDAVATLVPSGAPIEEAAVQEQRAKPSP